MSFIQKENVRKSGNIKVQGYVKILRIHTYGFSFEYSNLIRKYTTLESRYEASIKVRAYYVYIRLALSIRTWSAKASLGISLSASRCEWNCSTLVSGTPATCSAAYPSVTSSGRRMRADVSEKEENDEIRLARGRLRQRPAPPVANQNETRFWKNNNSCYCYLICPVFH